MVEGVTFWQYPCKTATEAQRHGVELFNKAIEEYRKKGEDNGLRLSESQLDSVGE